MEQHSPTVLMLGIKSPRFFIEVIKKIKSSFRR